MCLIVFDNYLYLITECWSQRKFGLQVLQHLFHVQGSNQKGFNPSFEKSTREGTCGRKSCLQKRDFWQRFFGRTIAGGQTWSPTNSKSN